MSDQVTFKNCPACNSTHVTRNGDMVSCTCGVEAYAGKWDSIPRRGDGIACILVAPDHVERTVAAAVAAERERCAEIAEAFDSLPVYERDTTHPGHYVAGKIREGSKQWELKDDCPVLVQDR